MGLLSAIGGMIGLAVGGPFGAAIGSGLGSLAGGGDIGDAIKSGILGFGIGSIPGVQNMAAAGAAGLGAETSAAALRQAAANPNFIGKAAQSVGGALGSMGGAAGTGTAAATTGAGAGAKGLGSLVKFAESPLVLSTLLQATSGDPGLTGEEKQMALTGERDPDYRGTAVPAGGRYRPFPAGQGYAMGGYVQGPGTGRSDSIPAQIYQRGRPVEQAALSDGEFVMTNQAVRGAGNGDRRAGAARMYQMMRDFERRA